MVEENLKLNLGCGRDIKEGWLNLDCVDLPGVDHIVDLNRARCFDGSDSLRIGDSTVGEIYASHVMEHIPNLLTLGEELHRVAKNGARMVIRVPYGSSDDAFEDPTHVRQCFLGTFGYLSQPFYWRADYGYRGDWKTIKTQLVLDKKYEKIDPEIIRTAIMQSRNVVNEMVVVMECVKPIREPKLELQSSSEVEIVFF